MGVAQAAVPFVCAAILASFVAARRVRENIAKLALVTWLFGCNFVHGVNAIIWSSNVDLKAFGWCDIVIKLVLATTVAIPGACLCISHYLEMVSSHRSLPTGAKALRNRRLFDAFFCYFIPLIYLPLSVIGQNHRFDLIEGIGCMASVHPSTPASMMVWMPHILMCVASVVFSGMAIHNSFRHPTTHFSVHLESRSPLTAPLWTRTLAISMTTSGVTLLVLLFSMFSLPMSDFWLSWQHVHVHLGEVNIVQERNRISGIQATWWGLRVITLFYIVLTLSLGEETRDIARFLAGLKIKKPSLVLRPLITLCRRRHADNPSRFPSLSKPARPVALELRSGWDDDLDTKPSRSPKSWKRTKTSPPASPSPSPSCYTAEDSFMRSTLPYLGSPMGDPLGFNSPILPPPPRTYKSRERKVKPYMDSAVYPPVISPTSSTRPLLPKTHRAQTESKGSNIAGMLEANWPSPPPLTPFTLPSPIPSPICPISPSVGIVSPTRASSPVLSTDERRQACSYFPTSSPPRVNRPFEGSSIRSLSPPPPGPLPKKKKPVSRCPSLQSIRSSLRTIHEPASSNDVIHMAVVQETV